MNKQIKQNGEYLVMPKKKKLLYQRLYTNTVLKSQYLNEDEKKNFNENSINDSIDNTLKDDISTINIEINIPS